MSEVEVLGQIDALLASLDGPARKRVLEWARSKYLPLDFVPNWTLTSPLQITPLPTINQPQAVPFIPTEPWTTIICSTDVVGNVAAGTTIGCNPGFDPHVKTFWSDSAGSVSSATHLNPFS